MVEEPPRPSPAGSAASRHFVLHQQRDIERHLGEARGVDAAGADQGRQAIAMGVPGSVGKLQAELGGERSGTAMRVFSERRERAAGAAELRGSAPRRSATRRASSRGRRRRTSRRL